MNVGFEQQRTNMIEGLLRPQGMIDEVLLSTLTTMKREHFVPEAYRALSFIEKPIPLPHGAMMLDPVTEARILNTMVSDLRTPMEQVLLLGIGSGYLAALLSQYARHIAAVDHDEALLAYPQQCLRQSLISHVVCQASAQMLSYQERAPYDAVVVTYLLDHAPEELLRQLKVGGRLFYVQGQPGEIAQAFLYHCTKEHAYTCERLFEKIWDRVWTGAIHPSFEF